MLNLAGLITKYEDLHQGLWAECADTATKLENLTTKTGRDPPFQLFYKCNPPYLKSLQVFGKIGVTNSTQKLCSKLANHGKHCMFVSYAAGHAGNTYKMLNLQTKCMWRSCDIKWIAKSIKQLKCIHKQDAKPPTTNDHDDNEVEKYVQAMGVNLIPAKDDDETAPAKQDNEVEDTVADNGNDSLPRLHHLHQQTIKPTMQCVNCPHFIIQSPQLTSMITLSTVRILN